MIDLHPQSHLGQDDLLMVLAESDALSPAMQEHLNRCAACRSKLEKFEGRLSRLGATARRFTPEPARPFRLPDPRSVRPRRWLRPAFAAGLTAALVLLMSVWWLSPTGRDASLPRKLTAQQLAADRALMAEVDSLVENAMPEPYRELAAISEPPAGWDEDLINWIVPSI
jgi:hypothetical protein